MKTAEEILINTFEPNGFSIEYALNCTTSALKADPAYKRIIFAMKQYAEQVAQEALNDASYRIDFPSEKYSEIGNYELAQMTIVSTEINTP